MYQPLLAQIEAFLLLHGMSGYAFGVAAMNDPGFVQGLRDGREPRRSTEARVRKFMDEHALKARIAAGEEEPRLAALVA